MAKDLETDLIIPERIQTQNIFIPAPAFEQLIADLPLSADLIRTLKFFKFSKLGELHSIPYRKILKKFINVNLSNYNLIAELYTFLISLQSTETSRLTGNENDFEKEERFFEIQPEKEKTEICDQEKAENPEIKYSPAAETVNNSNDDFESFLEKTIFIAPKFKEYPINLLELSVRLENVLHTLDLKTLGDLHEMSVRQIFHTKNCGRKSIFELRDLIEKIQQDEFVKSFRKIEDTKKLELEKIHIPLAIRDLPISYLVDSTKLRNLFYSIKVKILGDLQDFRIEQIRKIRGVGDSTFTQFQKLVEKAQKSEFDKYLEGKQTDSFKRDLFKCLHRKIFVPENVKNISVNHINFSTRLINILCNLNIEKLGELEKFTFDDLKSVPRSGKDSIFELWQFVAFKQKNADERKNLPEELEVNLPVETALSELSLNGLLKFINDFVGNLPEREQEVVLSRFGGAADERILMLEEIGEKLRVTRERIRQMESDNLKKLKKRLSGISENALEKIKSDIEAAVCPLTARFLIYLTGNDYALFVYPPNFYLHLLKKLAPEIFISAGSQTPVQSTKNVSQLSRKIKVFLDEQTDFLTSAQVFEQLSIRGMLDGYGINDFFEAIRNKKIIIENGDSPEILLIATDKNWLTMTEIARQVLLQSEHSLTATEIVRRAKEMFGAEIDMPSVNSIANLPGYEQDFYLLGKKTIGLRQHFQLPEEQWIDVRNDFYRLLSEKKRPVSTTEAISKKLFDWTNQTTAAEATVVLREDERFKDLGRFLFALSEWQIEEREPIKDLIVKVLREAKMPLTATEIGEGIQRYRSAFTAALSTSLNNYEAIKKYNFGYYGLNEWDDDFREFFITNTNVLYRLVKRNKPVIFEDLCQEFGISYEDELANRLWRALRTIDNLSFNPVYKSPETKISRVY